MVCDDPHRMQRLGCGGWVWGLIAKGFVKTNVCIYFSHIHSSSLHLWLSFFVLTSQSDFSAATHSILRIFYLQIYPSKPDLSIPKKITPPGIHPALREGRIQSDPPPESSLSCPARPLQSRSTTSIYAKSCCPQPWHNLFSWMHFTIRHNRNTALKVRAFLAHTE